MEIKNKHKDQLKTLGLTEEDFDRFDGKFVRYEHDDVKGVRIYDPYYETSYNEYIGIDGWSAWSTEKDTFMTEFLKSARGKTSGAKPDPGKIEKALREKFETKTRAESE